MTRRKRTFSREFKLEALALSQAGERTDRDIEVELELPHGTLYRWRHTLAASGEQAFPGRGHLKADDDVLRRLRRENERLREERDILKKVLAVFSRDRND